MWAITLIIQSTVVANKIYKDGTEYTGKWNNGLPHGYGKLTHPNGSYYKGHFNDGDRHGQGTYESHEELYTGEFREDLYDGQGLLKVKDKYEYKGEFKEGVFHGQGYLHLIDHITYDGQWIDGKKHGKGELRVIILPDEQRSGNDKYYETYTGEFENDLFNGFGVYHHADGSVYEGSFKDNVRMGQGKLTLPTGEVYQGAFNGTELLGDDGKKYKVGDDS